ncbi:MAG: HlyD family type I secretion periplasmic adaptor subunit [Gammaproteobacteria bacterium]|nr:HlyD family type I secretion periplasmic adaptor subunit [Gammaproteobacteria bacterium]
MERIKKAIELARLQRQAARESVPPPQTRVEEIIAEAQAKAPEVPTRSIPAEPSESLAKDVRPSVESVASTPAELAYPVRPALDVEGAERPWSLIAAGILGAILLVLGFGAWVWIAPLSGAVIGPGHVKVDMNRKTVQHQEGGIVGEILIRDGSKVNAGQTLILLKDVRVDAGNELVRTQLDAELAEAARLLAEQSGEDEIAFPPELTERSSDPRVAELLQRETTLFGVRREALANQLALIQRQIRDTQKEVQARLTQLKADEETIKHHRAEVEANKALTVEGYVAKTRLIELHRAAAEYESRRAENQAELASAQQKISDLELRAETLRSEFQQEASNELRQTTATIFDLQERLRPAQDAEERQRITAPISGEVVDLRITSVGAVIAPREPILDIVPENPVLLVEARVRPEDISYVHPDSPADVRLTAFRRRLTPTVEGNVIYISADRLIDAETKLPYYTVHVRVSPEALKKAGDLKLQAGMPAEVFIKTTPRNALQYLLDPVLGFLQRSLREQ